MFGWLKRRTQIAIAKSMDTDIERFILGLKGASDEEIGAILAISAHWRNSLEAEFGWDLNHPDLVTVQDIGATMKLNRLARHVQKQNPAMATGVMVWLHTLRATQVPEIRLKGRQMWEQLDRGLVYAEQAAHDMAPILGITLNTRGIGLVPQNMAS